jgi:SAM-dependent methyltransferase
MNTDKTNTFGNSSTALLSETLAQANVPAAPPDARTYWDAVNLGRWGAYLCQTEVTAIERAHAIAGKPSHGVDLGCGSGRLSALLSNLGWQMTCIDVDQKSLSICRRNVPSARCILTEPAARAIPAGPNSSGILLCIEAPLLHLDWFLPEADRVLAPGGLLAGVWTNSSSIRGAIWNLKNGVKRRQEPGLFYTSSYSSWKKRLNAANFEMLYENGFSWGPFGRFSNSAFVPLFTRLERLLMLNRLVSVSPWIVFVARKHG